MGHGAEKVTHMVMTDVHKEASTQQSTSTSTGAASASCTGKILKAGVL